MTTLPSDATPIAKRLLEVIPPAMARIRREMRQASPTDLTVPQFRVLGKIFRGTTQIGEIAKHQGVSQPAMSKLVEGLVQRGLVRRDSHASDRRQTPLKLTPAGESLFLKCRQSVQRRLSERIVSMSLKDRQALQAGLELIADLLLEEATEHGEQGQ